MPLEELSPREFEDYGGFALDQVDRAARLDTPDWQILLKLKSEGFSLPIPDVQQFAVLARALDVRFRTEVALRQFDQGIYTAKTMFAMVRHLGDHPIFIGDLVGIAIAHVTIRTLDEMLERPGCPNLYWALTNLPCPLVSIEIGAR